jgi:hypothetical protein
MAMLLNVNSVAHPDLCHRNTEGGKGLGGSGTIVEGRTHEVQLTMNSATHRCTD